MSSQLAAPGKLFLAGEYAVLEPGRSALVLAVDRTLQLSLRSESTCAVELWHRPSGMSLRGTLSEDSRAPISWISGIPGELRFAARATELALRLCAEEKRPPRGFHATFENDLVLSFQLAENSFAKPGLGGSGAASVLAIRAACLAQERPIRSSETLALASAAHWVEQGGRGSGADVAASSLGGILEVKPSRIRDSVDAFWSSPALSMLADPLVIATPIELPKELRLLAVWSGQSSDTRILINEIRSFAGGRPSLYRARIDAITLCVRSLQAALAAASRDPSTTNQESILQIVRQAGAAMAALGDDAKAPIVTAHLAEICALASAADCAGKPSGAGGGDCAIVFGFSDESIARAQTMLQSRGYASTSIAVGVGAI